MTTYILFIFMQFGQVADRIIVHNISSEEECYEVAKLALEAYQPPNFSYKCIKRRNVDLFVPEK
mgnify:CR=1 FL=1